MCFKNIIKYRKRVDASRVLTCVVVIIAYALCVFSDAAIAATQENGKNECLDIATEMNMIIREYDIPGIAATVFSSEKVIVKKAAGRRRVNSKEKISLKDKFHIGSNTKAVSATVIALLVEEKKLSWKTKIVEIFPEFKDIIDELYKPVTLKQLLNHTAGIPPFTDDSEFEAVPELVGTPKQQRYNFAKYLLSNRPFNIPGKEFEYSNAGYSIASSIAEKTMSNSWEQLVQEKLFDRISIQGGFGWPALNDSNQPWGHIYEGQLKLTLEEFLNNNSKGKLKAHPPTDSYKLSPVLSPSANLHLSILDFTKFLQIHLKGCRGIDTILKAKTIQSLHTGTENYGLGWKLIKKERGTLSAHSGTTGTFYCTVLLLPSQDIGVAVMCNAGHKYAWKGCEQLVNELLDKYKIK